MNVKFIGVDGICNRVNESLKEENVVDLALDLAVVRMVGGIGTGRQGIIV